MKLKVYKWCSCRRCTDGSMKDIKKWTHRKWRRISKAKIKAGDHNIFKVSTGWI